MAQWLQKQACARMNLARESKRQCLTLLYYHHLGALEQGPNPNCPSGPAHYPTD